MYITLVILVFSTVVYFQVIVVHVGTNNLEHTPEQVSEGILEIVRTIREKHPSAYIVLPVSISYFYVFIEHIIVRLLMFYTFDFSISESTTKRPTS